MQGFVIVQGYIENINAKKSHHEIYLSDSYKTSEEKLKG
jgi:hypothetical protein